MCHYSFSSFWYHFKVTLSFFVFLFNILSSSSTHLFHLFHLFLASLISRPFSNFFVHSKFLSPSYTFYGHLSPPFIATFCHLTLLEIFCICLTSITFPRFNLLLFHFSFLSAQNVCRPFIDALLQSTYFVFIVIIRSVYNTLLDY